MSSKPKACAYLALALPLGALLGLALLSGPGVLHPVVSDPLVGLAYLAALTILSVVNLWEETAWMGVVQDRLTATRGPLLAAVLTGPVFALLHLPLQLGSLAAGVAFGMVLLMVAAIPLRLVLGWLYDRTGRSILLVAALHASVNATASSSLMTGSAAPSAGRRETSRQPGDRIRVGRRAHAAGRP